MSRNNSQKIEIYRDFGRILTNIEGLIDIILVFSQAAVLRHPGSALAVIEYLRDRMELREKEGKRF